MRKKLLVLGIMLMVAPSVMAATTAGMALTSGGSNYVKINVFVTPLPISISAEINSTGVEPGGLAAYEADLLASATGIFTVTSAANTAAGWAGAGFGVNNAVDDALDLSTLDTGEGIAQISSIDATGMGVATPGILALITIDIAGTAPQGIYTIDFDNIGVTTRLTPNWTWVPDSPSSTAGLTIEIMPEPASALLLLVGLPFLRRRRVVA